MRSSLVLVVALLFALPASSQTVDLSKWKVEQLTGVGPWTVDVPKSRALFTNRSLADRSVFYSDVSMVVINFRLRVNTAGDDDFIGFVLGFQPGDGSNKNADYLLVDWKQGSQSYGNWGLAKVGLAVSRVTGIGTTGSSGGNIDFWSHTGVVKELARGTVFGNRGWADNTEYVFKVIFTPGTVDIWVNGKQEFKLAGTFKIGRFGCYNLSQTLMHFQFPVVGSFTVLGQGCKGTAGTPALSSPQPPMLGENFILNVTNLPKTGVTMLALGVSKTTWGGIPLPLNMGIIGATGCTLFTSVEFHLPVANTNGSGSITLPLPNDPLLLLFPFYCQATVIDPPANSLGMILSNAAAGKCGVR